MSYARRTRVPVGQSKTEVERALQKAGADQFHSGWSEGKVMIAFRMSDRYVRIQIPIPKKGEGRFSSDAAVEAETRRRWRALLLYIKAKIESIESGIVTFDEAFLSHLVLPNRQTVSEFIQPQIESAYKSGNMPKQLEGY